jgi:hypothetical protein
MGFRCGVWLIAQKNKKICRPFKNGEMQGNEKIQGAQCIVLMRGLDFFADAADCHFGAAC